jgi:hypothetical protein
MQKILGIIGWIGTILVFGALLIRGVPFLGIPSVYPAGDQYATYAAWAGLVCVLVYIAGQWRDVATFYEGRGARYGTVSIVSVIVFLAILVAVNYLGTRQSKRWDLTANQVYSLSDQTIRILKELKEPVRVTVFERNDRQDIHKDRLQEYQYQTTRLTTEYLDPDREPTRAGAAKVETLPTILFEYQGRTERVTSSNEQDLTNALIKVVTGAARKVYFTQGHGEKDIASTDRGGLSTAVEQMKQDNFTVEQVVLIQQKTVPADATIVAAATDAVPRGLGHPRRQRRRPRCKRLGSDARHRRILAGRRPISAARDHRGLPRHHRLPDGPIDDANRRRIERSCRAASREHQRAELVGSRSRVVVDRESGGRLQRGQGRQAGSDHAWRRRLGAGHGHAADTVR